MTVDNATTVGPETKSTTVNLEVLAKMTGFPLELIQEEIFQGREGQEVSLDELRAAMLSYIDSTMFMKEE